MSWMQRARLTASRQPPRRADHPLTLLLATRLLAAPDPFPGLPRCDGPLDAEAAVRLALRHSPVVAAAGHDVEMARQMLAMAQAAGRPMLAGTVWGTWGDGAMIVGGAPGVTPAPQRMAPAGGAADANLMAMAPLYTGGRTQAGVAAARSRAGASAAELAAVRLDLATMVRRLVRQAALMRAMVEVYDRLVATAAERMRLDRAAADTGKVPAFYVLRDEAELASARQQQTNAVRDYRVMLTDLVAALGVHPLSQVEVAADQMPPATPWSVTDALDLAARQRPELASARAKVAAAGHDERAAAGAFAPQVAALGMADLFSSRMAPRFEEFTLGVTVGLPLLDGGERSAALRRARADKARLTAQEQDLALRVAAEVLAADARLTAARANLAAAQTGERAAGENYRLALARYEAGKSLHVEVLDALRMKVMAETSLQAARFDLASAADALRRAVGEPGAGER